MKISKIKSISVLTLLLLFSGSVFGAGVLPSGMEDLWSWMYENIILIFGGTVIFAVIATMVNMIFRFMDLQRLRIMKEAGIEPEVKVRKETVSPLKKLYDWSWSLVPIGEEKNIDLGHDYDGIRELDNRLPPWWLGIMYGSIIFAFVYMYIYHWSGNDWSSRAEYEMAMEEAEEQKAAFLARRADVIDENTVKIVTNETALANGNDIYKTNCVACHGTMGEGVAGLGPNLTDEYWVHGGSINDIFSVIKYGVLEKGMIAWSSQLRPSAMQNVASYILTLQGTNPPNAKEREGELYIPAEENQAEMADEATEINSSEN